MEMEMNFEPCSECQGKPGRDWCLNCVKRYFNITNICDHRWDSLNQSGSPKIYWCRTCGLLKKIYLEPVPRSFYYEPTILSKYHGKSKEDCNG